MSEVSVTLLAAAVALTLAAGCGGSDTPPPRQPKLVGQDAPVPTSHRAVAPDVGQSDDSGGMQVSGLHGHLDQYDIQQGVKPHTDAITGCYHDHIGGHPYVGGSIRLAFRIAVDGTVKRVRIESSDLGAWPVEKCLLGVARAMTFARPSGGKEAKFSLPLDFSGRGEITPWDEASADVEIHANPLLEAWRKRVRRLRRYRRRHHHHHRHHHRIKYPPRPQTKLERLASCVKQTGARPPRGVVITLYVNGRGRVTEAGFSANGRTVNPTWADCAVTQLETWKLSPPGGGIAKVSFHYRR